jgi:hypothetical protein
MKLLVNVMPWFGDGHIHRMDRYISNDPATITKQLNVMQASTINGMRISGVLMTWQGPLAAFQHQTALNMCQQCSQRGMLFGLVMDPWCAKLGITSDRTTNVQNALDNATTQTMLNSPAYLPEKFVCDFNTGANLVTLATAFPKLKFLQFGTGFSWPTINMNIPNSDARNLACVNSLKQQNASKLMMIPGICPKFNDAGMPSPKGVQLGSWSGARDYTTSVWGDQPARVLDGHGGNFFFDQLAVTPMTCPYLGDVTWNDYDEGTAIEQDLSISCGIQI